MSTIKMFHIKAIYCQLTFHEFWQSSNAFNEEKSDNYKKERIGHYSKGPSRKQGAEDIVKGQFLLNLPKHVQTCQLKSL